ncbi:protein [Atlantibacter hermannii]|nr:protein [Atlantibacter hermannii]
MGTRLDREKQTIKKMIALYQRQSPQALAEPEHYQALYDYAMKRLDKCAFGENKPACRQCPIHCYQPAKTRRDEANHALGGAEDAVAASGSDHSPFD